MPAAPVPLKYLDLLEGNVLAHLATSGEDGCPHVNPVWILWDNGEVELSVLAETRKLRHMQGNPNVALSLLDPENAMRYLEVRGNVINIERYDDLSLVNQLSRKYCGHDYRGAKPGQVRFRVTVAITSWSAQG